MDTATDRYPAFDHVRLILHPDGQFSGHVEGTEPDFAVSVAGAAAEGGTAQDVIRRLVSDPRNAGDLKRAVWLKERIFPDGPSVALDAAEHALGLLRLKLPRWRAIHDALLIAPVHDGPGGTQYREMSYEECELIWDNPHGGLWLWSHHAVPAPTWRELPKTHAGPIAARLQAAARKRVAS